MSDHTPTAKLPEKTPLLPPLALSPLPPLHIPDHELLRCIGTGAYGEVWLARNVMGTYRAIKIVYRARFEHERPYEREFHGIQKFEPISRSHPSQVNILHIGRNEQDGYFYYVMELADDANAPELPRAEARSAESDTGSATPIAPAPVIHPESYQPKTLKNVLARRGRLPFADCLEIALGLATALQHLHAHGLLHRDIKPSNIVFIHGIPKLADIGLVAAMGEHQSFVGTEGYYPPEGPGSPAADIYSLGKVLYEMAMGRDRLDFPALPENLSDIPEQSDLLELNEIILKACAANPTERYASAAALNNDLLLLKAGKSVKHTRQLERQVALATRLGLSAIAITVVAVGSSLMMQRHAERIQRDYHHSELLRQRAERAEKDALDKLGQSYLDQARANRWWRGFQIAVPRGRSSASGTSLSSAASSPPSSWIGPTRKLTPRFPERNIPHHHEKIDSFSFRRLSLHRQYLRCGLPAHPGLAQAARVPPATGQHARRRRRQFQGRSLCQCHGPQGRRAGLRARWQVPPQRSQCSE
ncbi:MAG: serine/threonine-protein kinase [Verrucomicrobiota bacterium]